MALWENLYWEKFFIKTHYLFKEDLLREIIMKTPFGEKPILLLVWRRWCGVL